MATVHREIPLSAPADEVWDAVRRPGEVGKLLTFLGEVTYDEATRRRTAGFGEATLEELVVHVDDERRRFVYAITGSPFEFRHHSAAMQIVERDGGSTFVWDHDFLPDVVEPGVAQAIDMGVAAIRERFA